MNPREKVKVRCVKHLSTVPHFTDGKIYEARRLYVGSPLYQIYCDRGYPRIITIDEPSGHLPPPYEPFSMVACGRFEAVKEE